MKIAGFLAGCLTIVLVFVCFYDRPSEPGGGEFGEQTFPLDSEVLSPADKAELAEILRIKTELGDQVWPGLSRLNIPLVLYNGRYEFLVGEVEPPSPWEAVRTDNFLDRPYFRRLAQNPQSFAVAVGRQWAGSIGTLDLMNSQGPFRLSREFHVVTALHEVFHAFQATLAPQHFASAMGVYKSEEKYPYQDPEFSSAWNSEGEALAAALVATEEEAISGLVKKFLDVREARRTQIMLNPGLIFYERELEWLEGLAKYAEVQFYKLAASRASEAAYANYRSGHPFWPADLARLRRSLGGQKGDLRFYLSGAAQALLLDRLLPDWKSKPISELADLEDCLRASLVPGRDQVWPVSGRPRAASTERDIPSALSSHVVLPMRRTR